jgi:hypothetical protein
MDMDDFIGAIRTIEHFWLAAVAAGIRESNAGRANSGIVGRR